MNEEIKIKLGGDASMLARMLRSARADVGNFAASADQKISGMQKNIGMIGKGMMLFGAISQLESMMDKTKELSTWWGAFLADGVRGLSTIGKLERDLDADRKRYHEANDKRAKEMEDAADSQKEYQSTLKDLTFKRMSDEEKLKDLFKQQETLANKKQDMEKDSSEYNKAGTELLKLQFEIDKQLLTVGKSKTDELKKQKDLQKDVNEASKKSLDAQKAFSDRNKPEYTLQEIASFGGSNGGKAKRAAELERQAEEARKRGDSDSVQSLLDQADALKNGNDKSPEAVKARARIERMKRETRTALAPNGNVSAISAAEKDFQNQFGGIKDLKPDSVYTQTKKAMLEALADHQKIINEQGGALVQTKAGK